MSRLLIFFRTIWVIAFGTLGLVGGAATGYANGGWIGAILLGAAAYFVFAAIAVAWKPFIDFILNALF